MSASTAAPAPGAGIPTAGVAPTRRPPRTLIDHVNPTTRLLMAVVLTVPVVLTLDWVSATVVAGAVLLVAPLVGFGPRTIGRRLVPLLLLAPLGSVSMLLYGKVGGRVHWHWLLMTISDNSIAMAIAVFARVFALALPSLLLLTTVDPTDMADGLAQVFRLPSRFVLGTLAGVRMVGLFVQDWQTLDHARRARGLGDTGRVRRWVTMAFALMVFAVRRGSRLATAMEARGFGGRERTWARESRLGPADAVAMAACLLLAAAALWAAWAAGTLNMVLGGE